MPRLEDVLRETTFEEDLDHVVDRVFIPRTRSEWQEQRERQASRGVRAPRRPKKAPGQDGPTQ